MVGATRYLRVEIVCGVVLWLFGFDMLFCTVWLWVTFSFVFGLGGWVVFSWLNPVVIAFVCCVVSWFP